MNSRIDFAARLALVVLLLAFAACSSDDPIVPEVPGPTLSSRLNSAWSAYEAGDYTDALATFDQALATSAGSTEAQLGQGWCRLKTAVSGADLAQARAAFDQVLLIEADNSDALAGRSAASLAVGGSALAEAITEAEAVLQQAPAYVFAHDAAFNSAALRVIEAQAHVAGDDFAAALAALDRIYVSGISAESAATWVVSGLIEASFEAAVFAHLNRMDGLLAAGRL